MKLLIILAVASLLATSAWGGVHGGNGPDQEGYSVPLQLDRGIEVKKLEAAQSICTQEALEGFVLLREGNLDSRPLMRCVTGYYTEYRFDRSDSGLKRVHTSCYYPVINISYVLNVRGAKDFKLFLISPRNNSSTNFDKILNKQSEEGAKRYLGLPYFTFQVSYPDAAYDIDGILDKGKAIASNVQIAHIAENDFRLTNKETGGPSGYWIRPQEFKSCLERELFNASTAQSK